MADQASVLRLSLAEIPVRKWIQESSSMGSMMIPKWVPLHQQEPTPALQQKGTTVIGVRKRKFNERARVTRSVRQEFNTKLVAVSDNVQSAKPRTAALFFDAPDIIESVVPVEIKVAPVVVEVDTMNVNEMITQTMSPSPSSSSSASDEDEDEDVSSVQSFSPSPSPSSPEDDDTATSSASFNERNTGTSQVVVKEASVLLSVEEIPISSTDMDSNLPMSSVHSNDAGVMMPSNQTSIVTEATGKPSVLVEEPGSSMPISPKEPSSTGVSPPNPSASMTESPYIFETNFPTNMPSVGINDASMPISPQKSAPWTETSHQPTITAQVPAVRTPLLTSDQPFVSETAHSFVSTILPSSSMNNNASLPVSEFHLPGTQSIASSSVVPIPTPVLSSLPMEGILSPVLPTIMNPSTSMPPMTISGILSPSRNSETENVSTIPLAGILSDPAAAAPALQGASFPKSSDTDNNNLM